MLPAPVRCASRNIRAGDACGSVLNEKRDLSARHARNASSIIRSITAASHVSALFSNGRQWRTESNPAAQLPSIVGKEVFVEALHGDRATDTNTDVMLDQEFR